MNQKIDARIYFPTEKSPGILCEILGGYVYECGEPHPRPLKDYVYGRFVQLAEVAEATIPTDGQLASAGDMPSEPVDNKGNFA